MSGEISLDKKMDMDSDEEQGLLGNLEEKIAHLLARFRDLQKERDHLVAALDVEKDKVSQLEKKLQLLSQDREKVKIRIDQLLHRFKSIES